MLCTLTERFADCTELVRWAPAVADERRPILVVRKLVHGMENRLDLRDLDLPVVELVSNARQDLSKVFAGCSQHLVEVVETSLHLLGDA